MIFSSVASSAENSSTTYALPRDQNAIGRRHDLGQTGRDHHHRLALVRRPLDQLGDLRDIPHSEKPRSVSTSWSCRGYSSWPGIAVRRTASLPLAYVPAIHVLLAATLLRRGCPGHLARRRASRFCPGMTSFAIGAVSLRNQATFENSWSTYSQFT